jgi:PAS domain S-box-containing protein
VAWLWLRDDKRVTFKKLTSPVFEVDGGPEAGVIRQGARGIRMANAVNGALCRIAGYTTEQICARPFSDLSDSHDVNVDATQLAELLDGQIQTYQVEKRFRHAMGHLVWVLLSVSLIRDDEDQPLHLIAQVQDISERKELEGRLEHLVDHDFLTSLFNGRRFEQALAQETRSSARSWRRPTSPCTRRRKPGEIRFRLLLLPQASPVRLLQD